MLVSGSHKLVSCAHKFVSHFHKFVSGGYYTSYYLKPERDTYFWPLDTNLSPPDTTNLWEQKKPHMSLPGLRTLALFTYYFTISA